MIEKKIVCDFCHREIKGMSAGSLCLTKHLKGYVDEHGGQVKSLIEYEHLCEKCLKELDKHINGLVVIPAFPQKVKK